jgi:5-methylcytosine-specific restriction endonuclease McrA
MTSSMTLVLDAGEDWHKIISWRRAAELVYKGRAHVLRTYDEVFRSISREKAAVLPMSDSMRAWFELGSRSDTLIARMPAVIKLTDQLGRKKAVKFSRINVLTRDNFTCQYCGAEHKAIDLNYDHVIPKAQGGEKCWENIVMSCYKCNAQKGNRTPEQAGMTLLKKPARPKTLPIAALRKKELGEIQAEWLDFRYWNVELEP